MRLRVNASDARPPAATVRAGVCVAWLLACGSDPGGSAADGAAASSSGMVPDGTTGPGGASTAGSSSGLPGEDSSTGGPDASSTGAAVPSCNGHVALCDRRVDEVAFATTHNSIAAAALGFPAINANQVHGLTRQLDDGIRGLMLDVTEYEGEAWLCHGPCSLARVRHDEAIAEIGTFLDAHEREVIIIVYQDSIGADVIAADWARTGHDDLPYAYDGGAWPTLGALIDAGTRAIVTAESGGPPPEWFHHAWDLLWDTPYSFHELDEMTCDENRGTPGQGLYLVNHWLSSAIDLPDAAAAEQANAQSVLQARAQACARRYGHPVNLLAVDFYDTGDLLAVVDALNGA